MATPRRGLRSISENVWLLQNALAKILNDDDRTFLIHSLNQYQRDRDILGLVDFLKRVLDTPKKREVYPLLREIIPSSDKRYFERAWHTNQPQHLQTSGLWNNSNPTRARSSNPPQERLRQSQIYSSLPENLDKCDSGVDLPVLRKNASSRSLQKYPIRLVYLKRPPGTGYGFCMRGGSDHGVGLYVSSVDGNSIAEYEGLLPGDHILSVNEFQFDGLSHDQAVKIIKNNRKLNMVVRSVGRIPNTFVAEATYKWIDPAGQRVSPPPNVDSNGRVISVDGIHRSDLRLLGDDDERKVNVFIEDSDKLGLKIRGGSEYGLGIYIADVDPYSAAHKAGLKCGDQIMDVNGVSFLNITHEDAVKVLKSAKNMMVTMKDVGRLPFAKTVKDKTRWSKGKLHVSSNAVQSDAESVLTTTTVQLHEPPDYRRHTTAGRSRFQTERTEISKFQHGIAGSQLLYNGTGPSTKCLAEDQARQFLNENELGTMNYYMEEYRKGFITVDAFVLALFSLFNTSAKVSLLSEVRGSIHPRDIDRFDELVLKKEIEAIKERKITSPNPRDDAHSIRSYSSSASSFSDHGSMSSRSSAKESLDSRPITPPHIPELLPENMKVLTHTYENTGNEDLSSFMSNNDTSIDSRESIPSPPSDFTTIFPLSSSSPRKPKHNAATNGEITKYLVVGDNTRVKNVPHKKHEPKKLRQHSDVGGNSSSSLRRTLDNTILEKEHSKKNDSQSSSDHSFELIPEPKKEKWGLFHHNKGSYSPYKHDYSLAGEESSNLYHVKPVRMKDEQNAGGSVERSFGKVGTKAGNHFGTSSNLSSTTEFVSGSNNSEDAEEDCNDSTLVVDSEENISSSTLMNGYCTTSPKKQTHDDTLSNKLDATKHGSNAVEKHSSIPQDPLKQKSYRARTEGQNTEGSIANMILEGNQSLKSRSQSNSAFAPPKPKPYMFQAVDRATNNLSKKDDDKRNENTQGEVKMSDAPPKPKPYMFQAADRETNNLSKRYDDKRNKNTQGEVETSNAPSMPKPYAPPEESQASKESYFNPHYLSDQENDYVDIDSIRRSKQLSNEILEKNNNGNEVEHEYVDPKIMDLVASSPSKPKPYSSKEENFGTGTYHNGHLENSEAHFRTGSVVTSPLPANPPRHLNPYASKAESNVAEKMCSNTHFDGHPVNSGTYLESKNDVTSSKFVPFRPTTVKKAGVDKNNDSRKIGKSSNGSKIGSVVSPKPEMNELASGDQEQVYGMYLAMEETTTTRSGIEKRTSWGEESVPSDSYDTVCDRKSIRESEKLDGVKKPNVQDEISMVNLVSAKVNHSRVVSSHDDNEMLVGNKNIDTRPDKEGVTKTGHASPKERDSVTLSESVPKDHITDQEDAVLKYDENHNIEEVPRQQSVLNKIKAYNRMADTTQTGNYLPRKGSATNRRSWDGVGDPSKTGQQQQLVVDKKKSRKSNSDSNLMNLPKEQKKSIQVKLRASQELFELRQQSRDSSTNNSRRNSMDIYPPSDSPSMTASSSAEHKQSRDGPHGYDVEIEKTPKGLGLTLEGGSDTSSSNVPVKIKLIKEGPYDACRCGKLRTGQAMLRINDKPIQGMTNAMAILTLRQEYSNPENKTLLLVVEDP